MNFAEKRRAERFKGAISIELKQGRGLTRDFSTEGIYIETDQLLSVGEQTDFIIHLNYANPAYPLCFRCQGDVLRVEPGLEKIGAAVKITSHVFESRKDAGFATSTQNAMVPGTDCVSKGRLFLDPDQDNLFIK